MHAIDDLALIKDHLLRIRRSNYFEKPLLIHTNEIVRLCEYLEQNSSTVPHPLLMEIRRILFAEQMFLSGSTSNEVPYEVCFSLKLALAEWGQSDYLVTTALLDDQVFYFRPSSGIWKFVKTAIPNFSLPPHEYSLIQIALPRLYRSKPLFCIPLYHELGHFIDLNNHISELVIGICRLDNTDITLNHIREHFADLFAANYTGVICTQLLLRLVGQQPMSFTHPSTEDRISIVDDFVNGRSNNLIDAFQHALTLINLPELKIRFDEPPVAEYFDNMRPVVLKSDPQVHGLFVGGTRYMDERKINPSGTWQNQSPKDVVRIVNDLIEKGIRNYDISRRWNT